MQASNLVVDKWGYLNFHSNSLAQSIEEYIKQDASVATINAATGFSLEHPLDFLRSEPRITGVAIVDGNKRDLSVIPTLSWLKLLSLGDSKQPIDLAPLAALEDLSLNWTSKTTLPLPATPLHRLAIWSYAPKSKDLQELPPYRSLTYLEFVRGNMETLEGIGRFSRLEELQLHYTTKVQSIKSLKRASNLRRVHFGSFKTVKDFESIQECEQLESIRLSRMMPIKSLAFIKKMPKLREFRFADTDVLDGDMTPLLGLESVAFTDKRHFSHKSDEIKQAIVKNKKK